ncbi:TPA: RHS repeat-associated core domain-containing protein [Enterobacter asburiae]|nr:RHS repeat-associated core domain-containing protein [Enterobacter asburiae]HDR2862237.1 RHS repeat-associated core domain-containing protein [Enterobacter asburiae]
MCLPAQQYDEESGLCYNRHRYYDPAQGRHITQNPIGLTGGWNPYTYPRLKGRLKFRDPATKDLKANAGASLGLGIISIEIPIHQTA